MGSRFGGFRCLRVWGRFWCFGVLGFGKCLGLGWLLGFRVSGFFGVYGVGFRVEGFRQKVGVLGLKGVGGCLSSRPWPDRPCRFWV